MIGIHTGNSFHPLYDVWMAIIQRCNRTSYPQYADYGGRGIKVCDRWLDFRRFLEDVGERPHPKLTLDRIDNDGDYCKENFRWATRTMQMANQRRRKDSNKRFRGVFWVAARGKWKAMIGSFHAHLGYFDSENEAAIAFNTAAIVLWGFGPWLNQVDLP